MSVAILVGLVGLTVAGLAKLAISAGRQAKRGLNWLDESAQKDYETLQAMLAVKTPVLAVATVESLESEVQARERQARELIKDFPSLRHETEKVARLAALATSKFNDFIDDTVWQQTAEDGGNVNRLIDLAKSEFIDSQTCYVGEAVNNTARAEGFKLVKDHGLKNGVHFIEFENKQKQKLECEMMKTQQGAVLNLDLPGTSGTCQATMQRLRQRLKEDFGITLCNAQVVSHFKPSGVLKTANAEKTVAEKTQEQPIGQKSKSQTPRQKQLVG